MPRRRRHGVVGPLSLAALAVAVGACEAESGNPNCQLALSASLAGTPLTLLKDARLDPVAGGYVLLGSEADTTADGQAFTTVRWGAVDASGGLSGEQAYALPVGTTQAYLAVAGLNAPGDTVLAGYLGTDPTTGDGALAVIALPADGSPPAAPAATLVTFPGGVPDPSSVAMASSRLGNAAGLAWIDGAAGHVMLATVSGAGMLTGTPSATSSASPGFSCLGFSAGNNALTVTYYSDGAPLTTPRPGWVVAEANEAGSVTVATALAFSGQMGSCALVTPTGSGYALAWQDDQGAWLGEYVSPSSLSGPYPFAAATSFGGASLQPPLAGLAPFGTDFGVLFDRSYGGELWRVDAMGNRRPGVLELPSAFGNIGSISALPAALAGGESLVATYADYSNAAGAAPAGSRWFVNAVCY